NGRDRICRRIPPAAARRAPVSSRALHARPAPARGRSPRRRAAKRSRDSVRDAGDGATSMPPWNECRCRKLGVSLTSPNSSPPQPPRLQQSTAVWRLTDACCISLSESPCQHPQGFLPGIAVRSSVPSTTGAHNIVDPSAELTWCGSIATRDGASLQLNRHVVGLAGDRALPFILGSAPRADAAAVLAQGEGPSILDGSWKPPTVNRNLRTSICGTPFSRRFSSCSFSASCSPIPPPSSLP